MSKYRILEKKGRYLAGYCYLPSGEKVDYIPRFIVQEIIITNCTKTRIPWYEDSYKDLKEFNNLEEARKFKRDLELDEGIVIE